ncbi:unnamed protein product [Closterium sp. Naga37s-1]|nr:unnamed protein product [Closterium sp. Naga37s-1]
MSWLARLAVAMHVAQALDLSISVGSACTVTLLPTAFTFPSPHSHSSPPHSNPSQGSSAPCPSWHGWQWPCMREQRPMSWLARLAVAMRVAQALEHLGREKNMAVYHDLNPYKVLLDKDNEPKLSCFGLIKPLKEGRYSSNLDYLPPEQLLHGRVTAESVVYSFGLILLALFSGKSIRPTQFLEMVEEKQDLSLLLDSNLLSHAPSVDFALELVPLIAECLKKDPGERPPMDSIAEFLGILDDRSRGIGNSLGLAGEGEEREGDGAPAASAAASPLARAAMEGDWEVLHRRLVTVSFTPPQEPSFEVWNAEIQDLVSSRQRGDKAFKSQQWEEAIALYTKVIITRGEGDAGEWESEGGGCLSQQWEEAIALYTKDPISLLTPPSHFLLFCMPPPPPLLPFMPPLSTPLSVRATPLHPCVLLSSPTVPQV